MFGESEISFVVATKKGRVLHEELKSKRKQMEKYERGEHSLLYKEALYYSCSYPGRVFCVKNTNNKPADVFSKSMISSTLASSATKVSNSEPISILSLLLLPLVFLL